MKKNGIINNELFCEMVKFTEDFGNL